METNTLPRYGTDENPTACCPKFNPQDWDEQILHFRDKLFYRADTRSVFHIPLNMGKVMDKSLEEIHAAHADSSDDFVVLSHDTSPWHAEHLFSITREVPGHETIRLSGDFITKVFEGSYRDVGKWEKSMEHQAARHGRQAKKTYFFYTTCPKCAKHYGKNYVVGVTEIS